jgi:hypothetical protein
MVPRMDQKKAYAMWLLAVASSMCRKMAPNLSPAAME